VLCSIGRGQDGFAVAAAIAVIDGDGFVFNGEAEDAGYPLWAGLFADHRFQNFGGVGLAVTVHTAAATGDGKYVVEAGGRVSTLDLGDEMVGLPGGNIAVGEGDLTVNGALESHVAIGVRTEVGKGFSAFDLSIVNEEIYESGRAGSAFVAHGVTHGYHDLAFADAAVGSFAAVAKINGNGAGVGAIGRFYGYFGAVLPGATGFDGQVNLVFNVGVQIFGSGLVGGSHHLFGIFKAKGEIFFVASGKENAQCKGKHSEPFDLFHNGLLFLVDEKSGKIGQLPMCTSTTARGVCQNPAP